MNGPSWKLEDDLATITITFPTSPLISIAWSAPVVDEVLENSRKFASAYDTLIPRNLDSRANCFCHLQPGVGD